MSAQLTTRNPDPSTIKKMEAAIQKEADREEKLVAHAIKDLNHTEKAEYKANRAEEKAEKSLAKTEKKEASAHHAVDKAAHQLSVSEANRVAAEKAVTARQQEEAKLKQDIATKKAHVEEAMKQKEEHKATRQAKLDSIHRGQQGPAAIPNTGNATV